MISNAEKLRSFTKGGSGSGNFGHSGIPGQVGGSGSGGGSDSTSGYNFIKEPHPDGVGWASSLSKEQERSVDKWEKDVTDYRKWQKEGKNPKSLQNLDQALSTAPTVSGIEYRGLVLRGTTLDEAFSEGSIITFDTHASASPNMTDALGYTKPGPGGQGYEPGKATLLRIKSNSAKDISAFKRQSKFAPIEHVITKGSKFRVTGIKKSQTYESDLFNMQTRKNNVYTTDVVEMEEL